MALFFLYCVIFFVIVGFELLKRLSFENDKNDESLLQLLMRVQTMFQARLKPAQWVPFIRNLHRYKMNLGTFESIDEAKIISAVKKSKLIPQLPLKQESKNKYTLYAYFYTKIGWLDIVTLKINIDESKNETSIYGIGESTGLLPLTIPFAPFFNILFCWFPFQDFGKNKKYLKTIQKNLTQK